MRIAEGHSDLIMRFAFFIYAKMHEKYFQTAAFMVVALGLCTQIIFYTVTKEPPRVARNGEPRQLGILYSFRISLSKWMYRFQFYQVNNFLRNENLNFLKCHCLLFSKLHKILERRVCSLHFLILLW